jgi:hypothetical protein
LKITEKNRFFQILFWIFEFWTSGHVHVHFSKFQISDFIF